MPASVQGLRHGTVPFFSCSIMSSLTMLYTSLRGVCVPCGVAAAEVCASMIVHGLIVKEEVHKQYIWIAISHVDQQNYYL